MDKSNNTRSEENNNCNSEETSMNEELKEWIKQEKKNKEDFKKSEQFQENKSCNSEGSSMNEELKEWIKQEKKNIEDFKKSEQYLEKKNESVQGICEICEDNKAEFMCLKCNQKVCPSCYFVILGICVKCVPKNIAERWDGTNPDWEKILGVEWVD